MCVCMYVYTYTDIHTLKKVYLVWSSKDFRSAGCYYPTFRKKISLMPFVSSKAV